MTTPHTNDSFVVDIFKGCHSALDKDMTIFEILSAATSFIVLVSGKAIKVRKLCYN